MKQYPLKSSFPNPPLPISSNLASIEIKRVARVGGPFSLHYG